MISIIVPVYKEGKSLLALVDYLQNLTSSIPYEIIIAATVEEKDFYSFDQRAVAVVHSSTLGRAAQMNYASSLAKGDIYAFLHADVTPPDSFLEDISATIHKGCDAGFFSYKFDKKGFFLDINASFTGRDGFFTGGGDQCLFITKSAFGVVGRFNDNQVLMEDFEIFRRIKKHKLRYEIVQNDLKVSARKYGRNSYLRVNLSNLLLVLLFKMGSPPTLLKKLHNSLIRQ